ncbi:PTS sugar transporter subunit IIA [Lacticigenium naphthae]|uniref:PTS sugar transporter subunit IIA n=1 Tax=Lacticigenium naphthae TaxID=515351 RepID=UPI000405C216|nr:PTS sugar transporter subunit IIA [Lacticigenium naphthae]
MDLDLSKSLVFIDLDLNTKEEVLLFLSEELCKRDLVKAEYQQAILEREKVYPTGLPSPGVNIAIPHADNNLVNETSIAIGILKKPVLFNSMENTETELGVQMVIMLAIKEPHGQIEMLQKVVTIIQNEELTNRIVNTSNKSGVLEMLEPYLYQKQE